MELKNFNIKNIDFKNMDDKQKGMFKIGAILGGIFIAFILIFVIYKAIVGDVLPYDKIENIMVKSAKTYVKKHPEKVDGGIYGTTEIKLSDLISEGYMREMSKYTSDDVMCSGSVLVFKNLKDYSYSPKLDCGKNYKYKLLTDEITKKKNIVTSDTGLYKVDSDEPYYVYRGEFVDNYVKFQDKLWRILRIDDKGNIRLFQEDKNNFVAWDNRYNTNKKYNSGINEFEGTQASRLKDELISLYNSNKIITKDGKSLVVPQEFCIGKRSDTEIDNTGSIECSEKSEMMGAGTISLNEYFEASIDPDCFSKETPSCKNYNYLASYSSSYWTLTANSENTNQVFQISTEARLINASIYGYTHLVITINGNVNYVGGKGTKNNPYIIEPVI